MTNILSFKHSLVGIVLSFLHVVTHLILPMACDIGVVIPMA